MWEYLPYHQDEAEIEASAMLDRRRGTARFEGYVLGNIDG